MAKRQIRDYVFSPGLSGIGTLKVLDKVGADQILLITNATANIVMYNFADNVQQISASFTETSDGSDPDFPFASTLSNGVTTITFLFDTSTYSSSDEMMIFIEGDEVKMRPYDFGTDAIERMRFAEPLSMLDADFEYGIQPTKWQTIDLVRGYPSSFEFPGADVSVSSITTDASTNSGGIGPSLITVDTELEHGFSVGDPITLKGVNDGIEGFAKAEGSFIISAVPDPSQFTFYAKGKVGLSPATSLLSGFVQLRKAGFYTGASLGNPTLAVESNGASGQLTTRGSTAAGSGRIGITVPGSPPPVGAPLSATGLASGTQITGYVGSNTTINITTSFTAPVSQIVLNDTTGIDIGAALDNGNGSTIFVTNIETNTISLSAPYTADRTGNSFISTPTSPTTINFGNGTGTTFNIIRTSGAYTGVDINQTTIYDNVQGDTYGGLGSNATFNIERDGTIGSASYANVFVSNSGSTYSATETIVILGTNLGGATPANDLTITIDAVDANGQIQTITPVGTAAEGSPSAGTGYEVGEKIVIYGNVLGGNSPANDLNIFINTVGAAGEVLTFTTIGQGIPSTQEYTNVSGSAGAGLGINAGFNVTRTGSGSKIAQIEWVEVGGTIETGDTFSTTITDTTTSTAATYVYTALASDTITEVRNGLINLINDLSSGNQFVFAEAANPTDNTFAKLQLTARVPGQAFSVTVETLEGGGGTANTQTMTTVNFTPNENTTTTPTYGATITNPGSSFQPNDTVIIDGGILGGQSATNDLTVTVTSVGASGEITAFSIGGTAANGNATFIGLSANNTAFNATFLPRIIGGGYSPEIANGGTGYQIGYQFSIGGQELGGIAGVNDMTITVTDIDYLTGQITAITASGSPVSGETIAFYPAVSLSSVTSATINNGTNITYSAIARISATFSGNHGLVPGNTILSAIGSTGNNHDLASGPFFIEEVPSLDKFVFTTRTTGTIDTGTPLTGDLYTRPDCFYTHRPFDGGVQLGTGSPSHGAQAIRQSKKYIRYQSGKGIQYTTGALFAPSYDLRSVTADGTAIGSIITVTTDDVDHGLQVGAEIALGGITTTGYNGHYVVASIVNEITLTVLATEILATTSAEFGQQPSVSLYKWKGSTVRSGAFDDQNGIFFQYDGTNLSVGLRSSTFQIAGTVSATPDSNLITGTNTKFTEQLTTGDRLVIRGMSHVVTSITNDTNLTVNPDYRGAVGAIKTKAALTKDIIIPQSQWNIDKCDGTGKSGYSLQINTMQMIGFQYTWYGAGFIDWMFRGPSGNFVFAHRLKNNNRNREAFMRSGNLPVRYEVLNEGPRSKLVTPLYDTDVEHMTVQDVNLFPDTGVVYVGNELIRYSSRNTTLNRLVGLTRTANLNNYTAGANRTYTAGSASTYNKNEGVILLTTTATPQINHWGSAYLTDGGFDEDRGYLFNYQESEIEISVTPYTVFLIRLSPSVSNALTGDLGERELINRAQLLLKSVEITTQGGSSSQGVIVEGILNPINYPNNPADITWGGLNTSGEGGQPSFAQIASGSSANWSAGGSNITATNATTRNYWTRWVRFNKTDVQGVEVGMQATGGSLPGGSTVSQIRNANSTQVWIVFSQNTYPGSTGSTTYTFIVPPYAQPGERIFSFVASPGQRDGIDLTELKELTNTPIGGRGTFPNGPDVLAINVYCTSGSAFNSTINLRWGEAQA